MMQSILAACQVLYVDHIAVTTPVFEQSLADYLGLPGSRLLKGPALNPVQKVRYAFVQLAEGNIVEILGVERDSPIANHVQHGGGPYHFCYAVPDIVDAVKRAESLGAKTLVAPVPDVAFDGRRVTFLFHRSQGVFELVEAFPGDADLIPLTRPVPVSARRERSKTGATSGDVSARLESVLRRMLPSLAEAQVSGATMGKTQGWDSLAQIRIVMEIESEFGVNVPSEKIAELTAYEQLLQWLRSEEVA